MKISQRFQWRQTTCSNHSRKAQIILRKPKKQEKVKDLNKDNIQIKFAPKNRLVSIVQRINIMLRYKPLQQQVITLTMSLLSMVERTITLSLSMVERSRYHWVRINKCSSFSLRMLNLKHLFCSTTSMTTVSHKITHKAGKLNVRILTCSIINKIYGLVEWSQVIEFLQDRIWLVGADDKREEVILRWETTLQELWQILMSLAGPEENRRLFITSIIKIKSINFIHNQASHRITLNS